MIDYHVHTPLCNHADGEMEAYVRKAADIGLKEICFLDHLTICETGKNLSMSVEEVPSYFKHIQVLKKRYESIISVKAGLEIDFSPEHADLFTEIVATYDFDVIGSSAHFFGEFDVVRHRSDWNHGKGDTDRVYGLFYDQLEKMLEYDYFDILCHFDLIKKFNRRASILFDKKIDDILSVVKAKNLGVEINTSGYNHKIKEPYPSQDIIDACIEKEIHLTLASDAHHPEEVGRHFDRVIPLLIAAGCRHLTTYSQRKPRKIAIEASSYNLKPAFKGDSTR